MPPIVPTDFASYEPYSITIMLAYEHLDLHEQDSSFLLSLFSTHLHVGPSCNFSTWRLKPDDCFLKSSWATSWVQIQLMLESMIFFKRGGVKKRERRKERKEEESRTEGKRGEKRKCSFLLVYSMHFFLILVIFPWITIFRLFALLYYDIGRLIAANFALLFFPPFFLPLQFQFNHLNDCIFSAAHRLHLSFIHRLLVLRF